MSASPEKLPQNICAVPVPKNAEFAPFHADGGEPGGTSGFPNAFATFCQFPRQEEG
jgi:hypothetical protein